MSAPRQDRAAWTLCLCPLLFNSRRIRSLSVRISVNCKCSPFPPSNPGGVAKSHSFSFSLFSNTNFPFHFSQHMSYFRNNRNNVLVRVLHASRRDNPQIPLTYTINVCFLLMQSLISWSGSSSSSHYSGSQAVSILLCRVGATELLWHNPTNRGEQTLSLSLNGLAQQWHTSVLPARRRVVLPNGRGTGKCNPWLWLVSHIPAVTLHSRRGAESLLVSTTSSWHLYNTFYLPGNVLSIYFI